MKEIDVNTLTTVAECRALEVQANLEKNTVLANAARERRHQISIDHLKTQKECDIFINNARNQGREDLVSRINLRSIELSLKEYATEHATTRDVEIACLKVLLGYERQKTLQKGRKSHATYTRRAFAQKGILPTVDAIVSKKRNTSGFENLQAFGLTEESFEAVVIKFPADFSQQAQLRAHERLRWHTNTDTATG